MATQDIAAALQRVEAVFQRRPEAALHEDPPGIARWEGGLRAVATHANGRQVQTDMPEELGGTGDQVSPGWLLRAGVAACATTSIAMAAAREGITLTLLEVQAGSRSDSRGLLGMPDAQGQPVFAGPLAMTILVRISAPGVPADRLRALVERGHANAPMSSALRSAVPTNLSIEINGS
jgi:uncharacterized OsmC-like protein